MPITTTKDRRIIRHVKGSSSVKAWAWEADESTEKDAGGHLVVIFHSGDHPYTYRVESWVPGLLIETEESGRSVGKFFRSIFGKGARLAGRLDTAPGLHATT